MAAKQDIPVYQSDENFYANWLDYVRDAKRIALIQNPKENKVKAAVYGKKLVDSLFEYAVAMLIDSGETKAILRMEDMLEITVEKRAGTGAGKGNYAVSVEALSELKKAVKNDTDVEFNDDFNA